MTTKMGIQTMRINTSNGWHFCTYAGTVLIAIAFLTSFFFNVAGQELRSFQIALGLAIYGFWLCGVVLQITGFYLANRKLS